MDKDKLIGTRLDGRYELTDLVGEGGMANVYRASDVLDNRVVAVKILKNEYSESEEFQRRFRDESKAIAMMSHPTIWAFRTRCSISSWSTLTALR